MVYLSPPLPIHDEALVVIHCLWHGILKGRKVIVETERVANGQYSHLVLLSAFDCVDDTMFGDHIIISEIIRSLSNIVNDKHGKKSYCTCRVPEILPTWYKKSSRFFRKAMTMHIVRMTLWPAVWNLGILLPPFAKLPARSCLGGSADQSTCVLVSDILNSITEDVQPPWVPSPVSKQQNYIW